MIEICVIAYRKKGSHGRFYSFNDEISVDEVKKSIEQYSPNEEVILIVGQGVGQSEKMEDLKDLFTDFAIGIMEKYEIPKKWVCIGENELNSEHTKHLRNLFYEFKRIEDPAIKRFREPWIWKNTKSQPQLGE